MSSSSVTLITPVWNAMPYWQDYLSCVEAQTWRPLQFVAVDDGSTDGSFEFLLKKEGALRKAGIAVEIRRISHGGQAAAVNAALPVVSGEFFAWCDADDLLTPDSLEKKVEYLLAHPATDMVRSDGIVWKNGQEYPAAREGDRQKKNIFDDLFRQVTYSYAGCYMMRTDLLFRCYPEKRIPVSPEGQNLQLLLPPASRSECGFLPERLFYYRMHNGSHSSRTRSYTEQWRRIENFAALRAAILPYCDCDRRRYEEEIAEILQRDRESLLTALRTRVEERKRK